VSIANRPDFAGATWQAGKGMHGIDLPERTLTEQEVADLAARVARRGDLVRPLVHHRDDERNCASLHADEHVGVWVISWMPGQDTGFHDHAGSHGAVAVVAGHVREERPPWGRLARVLDAGADEAFTFDDADIHRVLAVGTEPAVTVHVYSPPLIAMTVYRLGEDGAVESQTVRWDETLVA
jgi:predicted metal-dependent enzyme (double-stranded beta helix superfamily)